MPEPKIDLDEVPPAEYRGKNGEPVAHPGRGGQADIDRIADVRNRIAMRQQPAVIARECAELWGVTPRTIRNDIKRIIGEIVALRAEGRETKAAVASHTTLTLMRAALAQGKLEIARKYHQDYLRIEGLYAERGNKATELPEGTGVLVVPPQDPKEE